MNFGSIKQAFGAAMQKVSEKAASSDNNTIYISLGIVLLILIILLVIYNTNESFANSVKDAFNKVTGSSGLDGLDVVFFMNPECPWCQKQMDVLKKEGTVNSLTIKSIENPENKKEAMAYGVKGFPYFVSKKNKTILMGFQDTTDDIVKGLQIPTGKMAHGQIQESPKSPEGQEGQENSAFTMVILTRESCGWCKKAKEDIVNNNVKDVAIVAIDSEDGKAIIDKFKVDNKSGVPIYVNLINGRSKTGFMPIEQARKTLS
jgi:thiol-disulfide isomerase/thioredoxin